MVVKLTVGQKSTINFEGHKHTFERVNPYFVKVTTGGKSRLVSIEDTVEIREDTEFYKHPYFFKWDEPVQASSKTTLKFYLKLPLRKKLVIEAGKRDIVIETHHEAGRHAWHGPVFAGELCDFVKPEIIFQPEEGPFANVPVRVVNQGNETRTISKFVVASKYLMLFKAENGYFTNKVYVNIVREGEFSMNYGSTTTKEAKKRKKVIDRTAKTSKSILTKFSPLTLAKEFGLESD